MTRDAHRGVEPSGPSQQNIQVVADLEHAALHARSAADRLSDRIARMTGSVAFAVVHVMFFVLWIALNLGALPRIMPFDPFPFSFLTLVVSLEAIFLSVFVLMSQNRMTRQADQRTHLDLQVNLLAEQELTAILRMLEGLCRKHEIVVNISDERVREMLRETDVQKLASAIKEQLPQE